MTWSVLSYLLFICADTRLQLPDHILTAYRTSDPSKKLIAKKVREGSDELEILKFLQHTQPKSDHIISLIDSFRDEKFEQWAILPKLGSIDTCLASAPNKVIQVCRDLIKGLAYLHGHCIAHRDIKPDNLVVDIKQDFCLKIIDFDNAVRVKDEDEEIGDQRGTRGWIAPEVGKDPRHSPIRADRWGCGHVLLHLLDQFGKGKEDEFLRTFAMRLEVDNPKDRPSLLEWSSDGSSANGCDMARAPSDVGYVWNADEKTAFRARQDPMEVDMKPPNAKKRRVDGSDQHLQEMSRFREHRDLTPVVWVQ